MDATNCCTLCNNSNQTPLAVNERLYFECKGCGLISLERALRLKPEEEKARYELHKNSPDDAQYREFLWRALGPLVENLKAKMTGLDYGCGPGPTTSVILGELGYHVENYDPFFYPRELSETEQFDFITCTETIEHFFYPALEFKRLDSLLSANGYLVLMTEVYDKSLPFENWWYLNDPAHVSLYQAKTFTWLSSEFNLRMSIPHRNVRLFQKH